MNKARILGIVVFIIGLNLLYSLDKYDGGFLLGMFTGMILALGFALTVIGKFKFWEKP
jgi:hypothetical protein